MQSYLIKEMQEGVFRYKPVPTFVSGKEIYNYEKKTTLLCHTNSIELAPIRHEHGPTPRNYPLAEGD